MAYEKKRIVFMLEDDCKNVHRVEVIAHSVSDAWISLSKISEQHTLIGVRSFSVKEDGNGVG